MKTYVNFKKNLFVFAGLICLTTFFSSCLKSSSNYYNPPVALVTFFQASPDESPLDLNFDGNRVNWNPIAYGTSLDYFRAYTGKRTINFYSQNTQNKIFSDTVTLKENDVYSLFLANKPSSPEIVLLNDTINKPASGMAAIRFVDLSPDATSVDLAVNGTVMVSHKSYKGFSSFLPVTGNTNYSFEVRQKGTSTVLASLSNVGLNNGGVYTIILTGLASGTTSADELAVYYVTNAQYY